MKYLPISLLFLLASCAGVTKEYETKRNDTCTVIYNNNTYVSGTDVKYVSQNKNIIHDTVYLIYKDTLLPNGQIRNYKLPPSNLLHTH